MKIFSTQTIAHGDLPIAQRVPRNPARSVSVWTMLWGTACLCVASTTVVQAQSPANGMGMPSGLQHAGGFVSPSDSQDGMLTHGDQTYKVVDTASYRTAADKTQSPTETIQQVGMQYASGNCSSCGTSACGGSCGTISMQTAACGSCGTSCGGRCGGRASALSCQGAFMGGCEPCSPYRYASVEALYMQRDDDNFNFNGTFPLSDFDYEFGSRIVFGQVGDCVNGYEVSFVGPFDWDVSDRLTGPFNLERQFTVVGANTFQTDTRFDNQVQSLNSEYYSLDASRTINGWEIAKLLLGGRYVSYEEDYNYSGTQTTEVSRFPGALAPADQIITTTRNLGLRSETENRMAGLQVGLDLLYPISRFAYSDLRLRAGAYANFAEASYSQNGSQTVATTVAPSPVTDGTTSLMGRSSDDSIELAGLFELGSGIRYQVGEMLALRAGVEVWYLTGVATATSQVASAGPRGRNVSVNADDDVLFTGLSFGAELRW